MHIHGHPELKNKVTFGSFVAVSGIQSGHGVAVLLAAEGVHIFDCKGEGKIVVKGTRDAKLSLDNLKAAEVKIFVSGMAAKAHRYDKSLLKRYNAELTMPDVLIVSSICADSVL